MTTFRVRIGGSPKDSGEVFDDRYDAEEAAIQMALEMATEQELPARQIESVDIYDLRDRGGDWGACPEGDDGAYWPVITEEE